MTVREYKSDDILMLLDGVHLALDQSRSSILTSSAPLALETSLAAFAPDKDLSCSNHCYSVKDQARLTGVITAAMIHSLDDGSRGGSEILSVLTRLGEISASAVTAYSHYPRHGQMEEGELFRLFTEQQMYAIMLSATHRKQADPSWINTKERAAQAMDAWFKGFLSTSINAKRGDLPSDYISHEKAELIVQGIGRGLAAGIAAITVPSSNNPVTVNVDIGTGRTLGSHHTAFERTVLTLSGVQLKNKHVDSLSPSIVLWLTLVGFHTRHHVSILLGCRWTGQVGPSYAWYSNAALSWNDYEDE